MSADHTSTIASVAPSHTADEVVAAFLDRVRGGRDPDAAADLMAPVVIAHQLAGEAERAIRRTPAEYADHVREMQHEFGTYGFEVTSTVAAGDEVAVTWRQTSADDGRAGGGIVELAACRYRVADGRICEYWLLVDRLGLERQHAR